MDSYIIMYFIYVWSTKKLGNWIPFIKATPDMGFRVGGYPLFTYYLQIYWNTLI
jgi:hypothetical protein